MHDELMVPEELPEREAAAAGAGFAYGIAVAVGVAVGPDRGRQEELPAAPGVFVAGGHFVGEPDVVFVLGGSECAHWVAAMAISTRVCTSEGSEVSDWSEQTRLEFNADLRKASGPLYCT